MSAQTAPTATGKKRGRNCRHFAKSKPLAQVLQVAFGALTAKTRRSGPADARLPQIVVQPEFSIVWPWAAAGKSRLNVWGKRVQENFSQIALPVQRATSYYGTSCDSITGPADRPFTIPGNTHCGLRPTGLFQSGGLQMHADDVPKRVVLIKRPSHDVRSQFGAAGNHGCRSASEQSPGVA